jgi:alkyldihydroxyacetonephosphate synthase
MENIKHQHRWGFADTQFEVLPNRSVILTGSRYELSGLELPNLVPFIEDAFQIKLDLDQPKAEATPNVPKPILDEAFLNALKKVMPERLLSTDDADRLIHSHGQTTADEVYQALYDQIERVCDLVVSPEDETQAAELIKLADKFNVVLVPYGGGTSVSCALQLPQNETRMIVVIDTQRLNKVEWIDVENRKACVQAGIRGSELEKELNAQGFTCGHEPDSIEFSTLGGWRSLSQSL